MDSHNILVLEARGCLDLSLKVRKKFLVPVGHFDRNFARHIRIECAVHDTHATLADHSEYLVAPDLLDSRLNQRFTPVAETGSTGRAFTALCPLLRN